MTNKEFQMLVQQKLKEIKIKQSEQKTEDLKMSEKLEVSKASNNFDQKTSNPENCTKDLSMCCIKVDKGIVFIEKFKERYPVLFKTVLAVCFVIEVYISYILPLIYIAVDRIVGN